jgi:hypothetical protein
MNLGKCRKPDPDGIKVCLKYGIISLPKKKIFLANRIYSNLMQELQMKYNYKIINRHTHIFVATLFAGEFNHAQWR